MKILAGPENWSFVTDYFRLALEGEDVLTFNDQKPGLKFSYGSSTFQDILAQLPAGWEPDLVIWWLPEFQPMLPGIEECPYPTLAIVSDWHVISDPLCQVLSMFDLVATDREGCRLLAAHDVRAFEAPLYGFDPALHRQLDGWERILDVSHVGDLHPYLHDGRVRNLVRAAELVPAEHVVRCAQHVYGEDYAVLLNRSSITINYALRKEMSMRCFEAPACGSLLFCEDSNEQIREVLSDGEHCVLYNEDNLVELLAYYIEHKDERERIAQKGRERIQDYTYPRQGQRLLAQARALLEEGRPARGYSALAARERKKRLAIYCYHVLNVHPTLVIKYAEAALVPNLGNLELLTVLGCAHARAADLSTEMDDRNWHHSRAIGSLTRALPLGIVAHLNLARVLLDAFRKVEAIDTLLAGLEKPFQPIAFYPRQLDPVMVLWEKERDRREATIRWRVYDLLSELCPDKTLEYSLKALEHRGDMGMSWFRAGLRYPLDSTERAEALQKAVACAPSFMASRLELARCLFARGSAEQLQDLLQRSYSLALRYGYLPHVKQDVLDLLQRLQSGFESPGGASLQEFVQGIRFEWLQAQHPLPVQLGDRQGTELEYTNTRFPERDAETKQMLLRLEHVPRMSTLAVAAIIQRAVAEMPPDQLYVNIGVWNGFTFLAGLLNNEDKRCVGVDNFSQFGGPKDAFLARFHALAGPLHSFHEMDYRDYFNQLHDGQIGVYLYDGEHSYENQFEGLKAAERFFAPGCIVLVDDTNWEEPAQATRDFVAASSRTYDLWLDVKSADNRHPTWWNGLQVWRCQ